MKEKQITVKYYLGGWNEQGWEGGIKEAMDIALAEIHEHEAASRKLWISH